MPIPLPYNFQNLDTSGLQDARDSAGEVIGKATPASYLDSNFSQLANIVTVSSTAPTPSYAGQLWLDTSTSPPLIKQWDGFAWQSRVSIADNSDKVDNFHASQTPSANTIVPLNADGILDLSGTYVKSNVYTFRRADLSNAMSDYMLQVGEEAIINFTNATSVPLRIATQSGTYYEVHLVSNNAGGTSGGINDGVFLNPNNTTYNNAFVHVEIYRITSGFGSLTHTYSFFRCGSVFTNSTFFITNFTQYKNVKGLVDVYGVSEAYPALGVFSSEWRDTTTSWTSLGTITFPQSTSGYILIRRLV